MKNRRAITELSYTFHHGREVYALCRAKLASGHISFEDVGPELSVNYWPSVVGNSSETILLKVRLTSLNIAFGLSLDFHYSEGSVFGTRIWGTFGSKSSIARDMLVYQNQVTPTANLS